MPSATVHIGNVLDILPTLPAESVNCVVTSPPYWGLRDYGTDGQLGLEPTPDQYVAKMVAVFREVRRVLREDGTLWLNLGDSYGGTRTTGRNDTERETPGGRGGSFRDATRTHVATTASKQLVGIPWRVAFALQADGWYLRSDIIWSKPNPIPESVTDRPTKAHEYLFLMSKAARYFYDADAVREAAEYGRREWSDVEAVMAAATTGNDSRPNHGVRVRSSVTGSDPDTGRNRRTVWTIATQPYPEAHFATYPEKLVEPCVLAGCPVGGTVLDPFTGSGTTGAVACRLGRNFVGVELNPEYAAMAERRIAPHRDQLQLEVTGA